jgi:anaerobic magnesium-protoporphyrin IX monomethyl ester cyclase
VTDVLLTHSYHLPYDRKQVRKMQPYPPLGTLYAASVLRNQGYSVAVFDTMLQDPEAGFSEALQKHRPRIVAIYEDDFNYLTKMCLTRMRAVAWEMIQTARSFDCAVIVHGSDATDHAEEYLRQGANFVLLGEAEGSLETTCTTLLRGDDVGGIPGLVSAGPDGYVIRHEGVTAPAASWINLPSPARDLIDMALYRDAWSRAHGYFSLNMISSRGCPYRCNWCAKPISGSRFHVRPAESVAAEMFELKNVHGAEHVWFGDDVFALNHHWVQDFAREIEARRCVLPFKVQSRADLMLPETVDALRRAGCTEVWMGVESGSQKVLDAMDKGLLVSEVVAARQQLQNAGIRACYFLQFGYPGETWNDIQKTVSLIRATRPDDIGVSVSYPLPNTVFYERVQAELGRKRNWRDSDDLCVMFKAAYSNEFYHALRDSLHAEVDCWHTPSADGIARDKAADMWTRVISLEPVSRNQHATAGQLEVASPGEDSQFVPIRRLTPVVREA